jgi:hypothetical protein
MISIANATVEASFGTGPMRIEFAEDPAGLSEEDRLFVVFQDTEIVFTVVGRSGPAFVLGCFLTPWDFSHWRLEKRQGLWSLVSRDKAAINRLQKFQGIS